MSSRVPSRLIPCSAQSCPQNSCPTVHTTRGDVESDQFTPWSRQQATRVILVLLWLPHCPAWMVMISRGILVLERWSGGAVLKRIVTTRAHSRWLRIAQATYVGIDFLARPARMQEHSTGTCGGCVDTPFVNSWTLTCHVREQVLAIPLGSRIWTWLDGWIRSRIPPIGLLLVLH
jgi:hypothetical protein